MTEIMKTKLRAVAMLICLFFAIVASAGAFSTGEVIYIVAGIGNIICTAIAIYKTIMDKK